jgi:hypothetical protein
MALRRLRDARCKNRKTFGKLYRRKRYARFFVVTRAADDDVRRK